MSVGIRITVSEIGGNTGRLVIPGVLQVQTSHRQYNSIEIIKYINILFYDILIYILYFIYVYTILDICIIYYANTFSARQTTFRED